MISHPLGLLISLTSKYLWLSGVGCFRYLRKHLAWCTVSEMQLHGGLRTRTCFTANNRVDSGRTTASPRLLQPSLVAVYHSPTSPPNRCAARRDPPETHPCPSRGLASYLLYSQYKPRSGETCRCDTHVLATSPASLMLCLAQPSVVAH